MNQIVNMIVRMAMNSGIRAISNRGKSPENMSREERASAKSTRDTLQQTRRTLNTLRRFMRF